MAGWTGLEPATSCVTGRRSNQLNYHPNRNLQSKFLSSELRVRRERQCLPFEPSFSLITSSLTELMVGGTGIEPVTHAL